MHHYGITSTLRKNNKYAQKPNFCKMSLLVKPNGHPAPKKEAINIDKKKMKKQLDK
jgi:hypothetical protein